MGFCSLRAFDTTVPYLLHTAPARTRYEKSIHCNRQHQICCNGSNPHAILDVPTLLPALWPASNIILKNQSIIHDSPFTRRCPPKKNASRTRDCTENVPSRLLEMRTTRTRRTDPPSFPRWPRPGCSAPRQCSATEHRRADAKKPRSSEGAGTTGAQAVALTGPVPRTGARARLAW